MSHCDLGYTAPAGKVRRQHVEHLRAVLALCRTTHDLPDGRRYKWTCEASWTVKEFLAHAEPAERAEFFDFVRAGLIELAGFFGILQSELASMEELIRNCQYSLELAQAERFDVRTAVINDVPGIHSGLVEVLAGCGVPYLLWGPNTFRSLVGWSDLPNLFYLQSKSGRRVLVWRNGHDRRIGPRESVGCQADYGLGDQYVITPYRQARGLDDAGNLAFVERGVTEAAGRKALDQLLEKMACDRYPYDAVLLQCTADNRGPDRHLVETVEALNRDYADLTFRIATPAEFFRYVESRYTPNIPIYAGEFIDSWTDGAGGSAQATAAHRAVQTQVERVELVLARAGNADPATVAKLREIYENLLLYSEHTFGVRGYNWWMLDRAALVQSWRDKAAHVCRAETLLATINPLSSTPEPHLAAGKSVQGESTIENCFYRIRIAQDGCVVSILDRELDRELIDADHQMPFGVPIFTRLTGLFEGSPGSGGGKYDPIEAQLFRGRPRQISVEHQANRIDLTAEIVFDSPPAAIRGRTTLTLHADAKRIDLACTLVKDENPEKEAVYIAFPWKLSKSAFTTRLEMAGHLLRFPEDLLSCSHSDFVGVRHLACMADEDLAVMWLTHDAPLVQIGGLRTLAWAGHDYQPAEPLLISYAMNNTWPTNFQLWQGGQFAFRYSLTSTRRFDPAACYRFKHAVLSPEFAEVDLQPANVVLSGVQLRDDGAADVRLLEIGGQTGVGRLAWPFVREARLTDLAGRILNVLPVEADAVEFPFAPYQLINVQIRTQEWWATSTERSVHGQV